MADLTSGDPQDSASADITPSANEASGSPATEASGSPATEAASEPVVEADVAAGEEAATEPTPAPSPEADAVEAATPEPAAPAPAAEAPEAAEPAPPQPELESSTTLPALGGDAASSEDGGEWDLLVAKVRDWLASGQLQSLWLQAKTPLTLTLALVGLLLVLRVYSALLAALDSLPLVPGLLELVGVIWAVRVGLPKLIQRSQREQLLGALQQRWQRFTGRN
jgi:hypothetical protein